MTKLTMLGSSEILENKYYKWYMGIINKRILSQPADGYCESHHIVPKSMRGLDNPLNLVKLTSREHFICHLLLTKFTLGRDRISMLYAISCMRMNSSTHTSRYFNSRIYEYLKKDFSYACSEAVRIRCQDPIYREKLSTGQKIAWMNPDRRRNQVEYLLESSPFKQKSVHDKSMASRSANGTNIFVTNNPMLNPVMVAKKVAKTSGENHFTNKKKPYVNEETGENLYFEADPGHPWKQQGHLKGKTTKAKGSLKPRVKCDFCEKTIPKHLMARHVKAKHENIKD